MLQRYKKSPTSGRRGRLFLCNIKRFSLRPHGCMDFLVKCHSLCSFLYFMPFREPSDEVIPCCTTRLYPGVLRGYTLVSDYPIGGLIMIYFASSHGLLSFHFTELSAVRSLFSKLLGFLPLGTSLSRKLFTVAPHPNPG